MKKIEIEAPAKLNVFLDVKKPGRADGFHELVSLTGKISLSDTVSVEKAGRITLETDSPYTIPRGKKNICVAAAELLRKMAPFPGARIKLVKRIPPGQGMGGGSSDAAAVIQAIDKLWGLRLMDKTKMAVAAALGSDVPLFLMSSPFVWIRGRGEKLELSRRKIKGSLVLWFGRTLSTKRVYEYFDRLPEGDFCGPSYKMPGRAVFYNALEEAAFRLRPEIEAKKKKLLEAGAEKALMTGSGSAVFGIFKTLAVAKKFAATECSCKIARFL
ncbi:MAG: 4-(cytidine 5'-diphospho)-2-C-methyl-D-erythritol kinase [Elusimicrobia bacterium HGW-Elusimicrobia-2]|nr:MAG: 4-(cytidine 5'-diphospho)-2-C-methyl-D-erythritol kinase [Elusimicrobia bacterium HGW-Elusimicrobia-2]